MASILEIYQEMSYGDCTANSDLGMEWLSSNKFGPFIDGKWDTFKEGDEAATIINYLGTNISVSSTSTVQVDKAVKSCLDSQKLWATVESNRGDHLLNFAKHLEKKAALLAQVEAINRGTLLKDAMELDVPALISWFTYFAGWVPITEHNWKPYGVVAVIIDNNTPLMALAWLLAPALAAGNCVCLSVPSETSLTAMLLADIFVKAGMPKGVFNVLPASQETTKLLIMNKNIRNVRTFSSTNFVKEILQKLLFDPQLQITALKSGRTPMLVFDSSDIDSAVESAVRSAWQNQGSLPWSLKLLLVQESVFQLFVEKIKLRLKSLRLGNPFDKLADIGKPYDGNVVKEVARITALAAACGLEVYQPTQSANESGFFPPTLLIGGECVSNQVIESQEYPPVISVIPFRTAKEAVAMANNSRYGLAASVWTNKITLAIDVSDLLQYGTVWINCHGVVDPSVPLQGWKESDLGNFGGETGYRDCCYQQQQDAVPEMLTNNDVPDINERKSTNYNSEINYKLYHSGGFKDADGSSSRSIIVNNETLFTFARATRKDVCAAVDSATSAFARWSSNAAARAPVLKNVWEKIENNLKKITNTLLLSEKEDEDTEYSYQLKYASRAFKHWGGVCDKMSQICIRKPGFMVNTSREPLGPIALGIYCDLGHQTYTCYTAMWQLAAALAFGNPVVVVVDMKNPSGVMELLKVICEAGIPSGILSVLTGDSIALMTTLAEHQSIRSVFHWNYPVDFVKKIELAALKGMKVVRPCIVESDSKPISREYTETSVTRSKAVWFSKGEIFAN